MNILGTSYSVTYEPSEMMSISKDELTALRAELASYRALPLIPKPDHDRVVQQLTERAERAEANVDALAHQLADNRDSRASVAVKEAVSVIAPVAAILSKSTPADNERNAFAGMFAYLAEHSQRSPEVQVMLAAYAEWEARR